jgi:hypothetical protein
MAAYDNTFAGLLSVFQNENDHLGDQPYHEREVLQSEVT